MRILFLNYEYPPLGGGAGVATRYLLDALDGFGDIEVDLLTSSVDESRLEQRSPRIRIHYLDIGKHGSLHYQSQGNLLTYAARSFFLARRLLRQRRYDLTHAFFGIPSGPVAMGLGLPYVVSLRGSDVPFYNARFKLLDTLFFKQLSLTVWRGAAAVTANSDGLKELARKSAPTQPIQVIYNGVDTERYRPPSHPPKNDKLTLVSTGRLIERKGYHHLIEALAGIDGVRLRLIGDGNRLETLAALASKSNAAVDFLGPMGPDEVAAALREADLFVLPSLNEGMSNALLEALASGLPVVVTDVGGSAELVEDNGFIVEKGSAAALRNAITRYLENPALLEAHGAASRRQAQKMSIEAMGRKYRELYLQVMRKTNKTPRSIS